MSGTTDLAVRNGSVQAHAPGALAVNAGQTAWSEMQQAALGQLGLKDAPDGDKLVFLHQCQRTGLDPFARQIYMIGRPEKVPGTQNQWRTKYTIQTGIDGFRVNRARAERKAGVRGTLGRPVFYDGEGTEYKVWVQSGPPVACEITYTVKDENGETPYTSVLRFDEYVQTKDNRPVAQWATKPAHMLEKCTEADVYRKAFPQDFSGVYLDDAMPLPDPGEAAPPQRQRVTADDIRQRRQIVTAEVVTPQAPPSPETAPAAPLSGPPLQREDGTGGGGRPAAFRGQLNDINRRLEQLGYAGDDQRETRIRVTCLLAGLNPEDIALLTHEGAAQVLKQLGSLDEAGLAATLDDMRAAREQDAAVEGGGDGGA